MAAFSWGFSEFSMECISGKTASLLGRAKYTQLLLSEESSLDNGEKLLTVS
jgi:hypothetical protein